MKVRMQCEKTDREQRLERKRQYERARQRETKARRDLVSSIPVGDRQAAKDLEYAEKNRLKVEGDVTVHRCL